VLTSEDSVEVAALVARYNRAFDSGDVEEWVATFTADGEFVSPSDGPVSGHDSLRAWFTARPHTSIHITTDTTMHEEGDVLKHICSLIVFRRVDNGAYLRSVGIYEDELIRTEDGWRFVRRVPTLQSVVPRPVSEAVSA
jgi:ketosteroid isomerase-like protein